MRVDVVTLFPEIFDGFLGTSFVGRALAMGQLSIRLRSPRDFGLGKHKSVDDTPYGGGSGMLMRVDVLVACMESLDADARQAACGRSPGPVDAAGAAVRPGQAHELAARDAMMLVCGRYEGFDERVRLMSRRRFARDFVMTGGEVAAMAVIEASSRLLPGVLGNEASTTDECTRPTWAAARVPAVHAPRRVPWRGRPRGASCGAPRERLAPALGPQAAHAPRSGAPTCGRTPERREAGKPAR